MDCIGEHKLMENGSLGGEDGMGSGGSGEVAVLGGSSGKGGKGKRCGCKSWNWQDNNRYEVR
jgi:hypothetical protein